MAADLWRKQNPVNPVDLINKPILREVRSCAGPTLIKIEDKGHETKARRFVGIDGRLKHVPPAHITDAIVDIKQCFFLFTVMFQSFLVAGLLMLIASGRLFANMWLWDNGLFA